MTESLYLPRKKEGAVVLDVQLADQDHLAWTDLLVCQVLLESRGWAWRQQEKGPLDLLDRLEILDHQDYQENPVHLANLEPTHSLEWDRQDLQGLLDNLVQLGHLVAMETLQIAHCPAYPGPLVNRVVLEYLDQMGLLESQE